MMEEDWSSMGPPPEVRDWTLNTELEGEREREEERERERGREGGR